MLGSAFWEVPPHPNHKHKTREDRKKRREERNGEYIKQTVGGNILLKVWPNYRKGANMERGVCCQTLTQCNHTSLFLPAAPHCLIHQAPSRAWVLGLMVDSCGLYDSQQLGWWPHHYTGKHTGSLWLPDTLHSERALNLFYSTNPQLYEALWALKEQFGV